MAKSKSDISLNDLKAMLPQEGSIAEQEAALRALTTLLRRTGTFWPLCRSLPIV